MIYILLVELNIVFSCPYSNNYKCIKIDLFTMLYTRSL